jgi:hypothetical protein
MNATQSLVAIAHGPGDAAWALAMARAMEEIEGQYHARQSPGEHARAGSASVAPGAVTP